MPKVSRETAPRNERFGPVADLAGELEDWTVDFVVFEEDIDASPLYRGLPDDRCQCPHWGYVFRGAMTMRFADREERYDAGDAFYAPAGHVPVAHEPGTEILIFSHTHELRATEEAMARNAVAMQTA